MNLKQKGKMSIFMACTMALSLVPNSIIASASTDENIIYENDFENGKVPDEVSGVITKDDVSVVSINNGNSALKFKSKFDGTDRWESNKHELAFYKDYKNKISKGATLQFDILIPTDKKEYNGQIKYIGGLGIHDTSSDNWGWVGTSYGDIYSNDFVDLGNGYSSKSVKVTLNDNVNVDLFKVDLQIVSYNCNYDGDIYIDNLKFVDKSSQNSGKSILEWNFENADKGVDGWKYEGNWDYQGKTDVSYDNDTISTGALKVSLDYSKDSTSSWSEVKLGNYFNTSFDFTGCNALSYDLYYDPDSMSQGSFMTKLFIKDAVESNSNIDFDDSEDAGNGLRKVTVKVRFDSKSINIGGLSLGLVGAKTDYKGDVYIDNIKFLKEDVKDIYVDKATDINQNYTKVDLNSLSVQNQISLVDSQATDTTASLYSYLFALGKTDKVLYGHQNDTTTKAVLKNSGTNSDTKDITGSLPGVCGIDALSFTGAELSLPTGDTRDYVTATADVSNDAAKEGAIVTLSAHMPNFAEVVKKNKINGKYDYSGYTPNVTTGDVVSRVMPGGDLNEAFTGYLDMIASYGNQLAEKDVSVLFRPFHENNGSWFWWGANFCDAEAYKNLYRYTVEYLRDTKGIHNFLYVYSPNGPFNEKDDYLARYPGDEFIDVMAFDMYHDNPKSGIDPWFDSFKSTINLIDGIAKEHNKIPTVSETGVRVTESSDYEVKNCGLPSTGNLRKDWFNEINNIVSTSDMPYFMVWANFDGQSNFFSPYMVSTTRGHEMINDFIDFYNDEKSVFANGVGDYKSLKVNKGDSYSYGYITSPAPGSRIIKPTTIEAKVKNPNGNVTFKIKNSSGDVVSIIDGIENGNLYKGDITQEILDKIGKRLGSIELFIGDESKGKISALFNLQEKEESSSVVDDFEGYGDEDLLLQKEWKTNVGAGCSVIPKVTKDGAGNHELEFNYKISTEKVSEGWAGITKEKKADWSNYNSLQFWCTPDGKGQKLVIQITSNGEDFEVYLPEFTETTEEKLMTIPFSEFKGKNGGTLDLNNIEKVGIWCNTIPKTSDGSWNVESKMYFDDLKAVYVFSDSEKAQLIKDTTDLIQNAANQKNDDYLNKAQEILNKLPASSEKDALQNRLSNVKSDLENINKEQSKQALVKEASEAVEKASLGNSKEDINLAQKAIDKLADESEKAALQNRLDTIKDRIK
ncbi:CIA30 family protein [Clostridium sp. SHJSY1]|uniref:glycosyl hydrolase n=1 Tax=Clostridium sp. SHJSY1 TaxID=2942483 RepID=UPI0028767E0D|nr:glycosyl hydrolase [Clostridium sp. SHJSY1]MDS0524591.1 CIA30 family protein [Clostridium sp. SHJSY1]